ncbi:GntR family transcriptional regulator [Leifsonia sp. NPDC056665]|uniref:GntR family transcriptional regulator n=1 Tax=Leifsonia sp. NPDC056665 TaxID=3345901 RepID=UPI00368BC829
MTIGDSVAWPSSRSSLPAALATELGGRIRSGEFEPGTKLPSEPTLAQLYSVSRNTVREAIGILREQSLVASRQGVGTVVLDPPRELPVDVGIEELTSTTELIERSGHAAGTTHANVQILIDGISEQQEQLQLSHDVPLRCIERVRTADGVPVIFCRDFISIEMSAGADFLTFPGTGSLFDYLSMQYGYVVTAARADVVPVMPSERIARLLEVEMSQPLLLLRQTHFTQEGKPFLFSENYFNPDVVDIHVRRTVGPEPAT